MQHDFINIGEVKSYQEPALLSCFGLGSCLGVFIYDFRNKVGGGAHIALASADRKEDKNSLQYAENAMKELIDSVNKLGKVSPKSLRAKVIGGANVLESQQTRIGQENILAVRRILLENQIFIAGFDVGGKEFRSGRFNTSTGKLLVNTPNRKYEI